MPVLIKTGDATHQKFTKRIERALQYFGRHKAEERPRHAYEIAQSTDKPVYVPGLCPHNITAIACPPHAPPPRRLVCLVCKEWASEDELRERGEDFDNCRDWIAFQIMDEHAALRMKGKTGKFLFLPTGKAKAI